MKKVLGAATLSVAVLLFFGLLTVPAQAGFLSVCCVSGDDPSPMTWDWEVMPDSGNALLSLNELYGADRGPQYDVHVQGETDSDPVISITKNVKNTTGVAWVGYNINLDPLDTDTFVGTPTSNMLTLASQTATSLSFGLPTAVLPGQTVQFVFDINVPDVGPFHFTLSQSPVMVPEPATLGLVGVAAVLAFTLGRKRLA